MTSKVGSHQRMQEKWQEIHAAEERHAAERNARINAAERAARVKEYGEDHNAEIEQRAAEGINALKLDAGVSNSGNCRAVYLITNAQGVVVGVHTDGGCHDHGVRERWPAVNWSQFTIDTTPKTLKEWQKKALVQTRD